MNDEITRVARAIAERALISSRHPWPAPDHPDWLDLACAALVEASGILSQPGALTVNCVRGTVACQEAERLRARAKEILFGAAAEIERLRARVEVLEKVREAALPHLFTPSMETGIALLKAVQEAKP
jgi:hypothetical protein